MSLERILYSSEKDFEKDVKKILIEIENCINQWIIENNFEYDYMFDFNNLTPRQYLNINRCIQQQLENISNNKNWAEQYNLLDDINICIKSLNKINLWKKEIFTPEITAKFVYNYIEIQLYDFEYNEIDSILREIVKFNCKKCNEETNSFEECDKCIEKN